MLEHNPKQPGAEASARIRYLFIFFLFGSDSRRHVSPVPRIRYHVFIYIPITPMTRSRSWSYRIPPRRRLVSARHQRSCRGVLYDFLFRYRARTAVPIAFRLVPHSRSSLILSSRTFAALSLALSSPCAILRVCTMCYLLSARQPTHMYL